MHNKSITLHRMPTDNFLQLSGIAVKLLFFMIQTMSEENMVILKMEQLPKLFYTSKQALDQAFMELQKHEFIKQITKEDNHVNDMVYMINTKVATISDDNTTHNVFEILKLSERQ